MAIEIEDKDFGLKADVIESGTIMPVLDAEGEQKYLKGDKSKPMQVRVRSVRSAPVKAANMRMQKKQAAMNRGRRNRGFVSIDNDEFTTRQAAAAAVEFINFSSTKPIQAVTEDDAYALLSTLEMEDLRDQIWVWASEDSNFGIAPAGNVDTEAGTSQTSESSEKAS